MPAACGLEIESCYCSVGRGRVVEVTEVGKGLACLPLLVLRQGEIST